MPVHETAHVQPGRDTRLRINRPVVAPTLVKVEVLDAIDIVDAPPPQLIWDHAKQAPTKEEPALILHKTPLRLEVTLLGGAVPGNQGVVKCDVRGGTTALVLESKPTALPGPGEQWQVVVEAPGNFTDKIAVHRLKLAFTLVAGDKTLPINANPAPLRLYTGHKRPIKNTSYDSPLPHVGKVHLEHACAWANGATANIGQGAQSIAHQVDNQFRHYVHPDDWTVEKQEYASAYAPGSAKPLNYADLPGRVSGGRRGIASLYYPPLEPTEDYQQYYPHYQNNFGWRLLDNPTHTGGRCNQQAALICEILGVLGIKASVYYLQRVGVGRRTGRPVRKYFNCYEGGQFWNFHGIVKVEMDDGTFHMYDGSFSTPPNRKHGDEAWAIGERGPFIYSWSRDWSYEDDGAWVPPSDAPTTWQGVP
jgi:hypothetical protein